MATPHAAWMFAACASHTCQPAAVSKRSMIPLACCSGAVIYRYDNLCTGGHGSALPSAPCTVRLSANGRGWASSGVAVGLFTQEPIEGPCVKGGMTAAAARRRSARPPAACRTGRSITVGSNPPSINDKGALGAPLSFMAERVGVD